LKLKLRLDLDIPLSSSFTIAFILEARY